MGTSPSCSLFQGSPPIRWCHTYLGCVFFSPFIDQSLTHISWSLKTSSQIHPTYVLPVFCVSQNLIKIFYYFSLKNFIKCIWLTLFLLTPLKSTPQSPLLPLCPPPWPLFLIYIIHLSVHGCVAFLSIVNWPVATPVKKNWLCFSQNLPAVHSTWGVSWGSAHEPFHPTMLTGLVLCKQPQLLGVGEYSHGIKFRRCCFPPLLPSSWLL